MLETGIGRAHSVALATLPGALLASDLGASDRYYTTDVTEPFFLHDGGISPTGRPGIGVEVDLEAIDHLKTRPPDRFL
jgi:O-succinylbenzoate synthase